MKDKEVYFAYDAIDGGLTPFAEEKEAQNYLKECFFENGSYHPDIEDFVIFKKHQGVSYDVVEKKEDYTDEEWIEEGYSLDHDEIWKHKFVDVKQPEYKTVLNYSKMVGCTVDWIRKLHNQDNLVDYGKQKGHPNSGMVKIDGVQFVKLAK